MIRDEVLRDAKWNFALGRKQLAKLVTVPEFEFSAEHQLPDDCLRVLALSDRLAEYKVEGRKILSNLDTVKIHYIRRITDTTQFDSMFVAALAAGIAKALAIPLTDSDSRHNAMVVLYDDKISAAKGADAQENGSIETIEADEWINARRGGGSVT